MHSFPPHKEGTASRSKLGATLLRLHRSLESSRQREQAALELFESWQSRWSEHRDVIARRLEYLDQELAQLTYSAVPAPPLSLMAINDLAEDSTESHLETAHQGTAIGEPDATDSDTPIVGFSLDGVDEGEQLPRPSHLLWHSADRSKRDQTTRRAEFNP